MRNESSSPEKTFMNNEESLMSFIDHKIERKEQKEITIVCAGHFMLIPNVTKDKLMPAIFDTESEEYYKRTQELIGSFPQYTWKLGCSILSKIKKIGNDGKLSLLVNDWQMVPVDKTRDESQPNKFRNDFYSDFDQLPSTYNQTFTKHKLSFEDDIYHTKDGEFYLREVRLRDRFLRKLKSILGKSNTATIGLSTLKLNEQGMVILDKENESFALTSKLGVGCAGGISQMVIDIENEFKGEYEKINFINLMPISCTIPVNVASELAIDILEEDHHKSKVSIVNMFFDNNDTPTSTDTNLTYKSKVACYEFNSDK